MLVPFGILEVKQKQFKQIKNGEVPERLAANPHVLAQKDLDARWTEKNDIPYFGTKDHAWAMRYYGALVLCGRDFGLGCGI